ncbi:MAG: hypothetical protein EBZ61_02570 [Micrococcales bacterium]|nr:hypothetical protein [Micrococcales bacterium]
MPSFSWQKALRSLNLRELNAGVLLASFGSSQAMQLAFSTLRLPLIATSTGVEVLGAVFLWMNILTWAPVLSAGQINQVRIAQHSNQVKFGPSALAVSIRLFFLTIAVILITWSFMDPNRVFEAGAGPTLVGLVAAATFSRSVGIIQGQGLMAKYFNWTAFGSLLSFVLTLFSILMPNWAGIGANFQVLVLTSISVIGACVPYVYAWVVGKRAGGTWVKTSWKYIFSSKAIYELGAVLPPAFITGFDALALSTVGKSSEIPEYGLVSRVGLLTTIIASALFVQLNNVAVRRATISLSNALRDSLRLLILSLPFSVLFLFFAPYLVAFLSANKVEASYGSIFAVFLVSLVLPFWIGMSATGMVSEKVRLETGRAIVFLVLPMSFCMTFLFSFLFGASGPFLASLITYLVAICIAGSLILRQAGQNAKA